MQSILASATEGEGRGLAGFHLHPSFSSAKREKYLFSSVYTVVYPSKSKIKDPLLKTLPSFFRGTGEKISSILSLIQLTEEDGKWPVLSLSSPQFKTIEKKKCVVFIIPSPSIYRRKNTRLSYIFTTPSSFTRKMVFFFQRLPQHLAEERCTVFPVAWLSSVFTSLAQVLVSHYRTVLVNTSTTTTTIIASIIVDVAQIVSS